MDNTAETKSDSALRSLLKSLFRELFQTETSAFKHCKREAERLGEASPARTLLDISSQAERFLQEIPALAKRHNLPVSGGGTAVGALFSQARDKIFDRLIRSERSYRGTMLGVRHGVDLMHLLAQAAQEANLPDLNEFCERWLAARQPLVTSLEHDLGWFAKQPVIAMRFAR